MALLSKYAFVLGSLLCVLHPPAVFHGQQDRSRVPLEREAGAGLKRSRLYLKDGSYQVMLGYRIQGSNLIYRSAERAGEEETIPLNLVDLPATEAWQKRHDAERSGKPAVEIDPELAREEEARSERSPEVAKDLHLPEDDSVLALDTYQGQPQLAPLLQTDGALNRQTAHNVLRAAVNPLAVAHQLVEIKGVRSAVQLHVPDPDFFVRLDKDVPVPEEAPAGALVVDTHGAKGVHQDRSSASSSYALVRVDVRRDARVVTSFDLSALGTAKRSADVIQTTVTTMPGGYWLKVHPTEQLTFGEYALVEVLDERNINLGVWDFGIHPTAGPNRDAILPEERRPPSLERHSVNATPDE